jgi:serine protease AprX
MRLYLIRRFACVLAVAAALLAPLAAGVGSAQAGGNDARAFVPGSLLAAARQDDEAVFDVLVSGSGSERSGKLADRVAKMLEKGRDAKALAGDLKAQFETVDALQLELSGRDVLKLSREKDVLSIVPNAEIAAEALDNSQHWDEATGVHWYWGSAGGKLVAPTIAIVDSGVDNANNAFGTRLLGQFDLGGGQSSGDSRGHGTFVAALAAGAGAGLAGAAPNARIVSLDVFDAQGRGTTSSVIRAADWILQHKDEYNIRVANFSLQTSQESSFLYDPLDQAIERLWQAGVVVVASAGNYAASGLASGVLYAPGNDPFVITVGAVDIKASNDTKDDFNAPWSAYGYTHDGFAKPELAAPGRYMIEKPPLGATLFADYPTNILSGGKLQLSGTSFSAPLVSGMAAALLASHPDWTPDQVKGALMVSAVPLNRAALNSIGVGEANIQKALALRDTPPNPNLGLNRFLIPDPAGGPLPIFDADSWVSAVQNDASWNSASWTSASWNSASWTSASWASASWNSASWTSASWTSASWTSASWNSVANNALSDGLNPNY